METCDEMIDHWEKKEFEYVAKRCIHQAEHDEVGEVKEHEDKGNAYEGEIDPSRGPPIQNITNKNEEGDLQKGLAYGVEEKEEGNSLLRVFPIKKMGEAEEA